MKVIDQSSRQGCNLIGVVTARYSSRRFPGKVLRTIQGRPMLAHVVDRLGSVGRIDEIIVATSVEASDDVVASFAETAGVYCLRGALDDVLGRIREVAAARSADAILRVSGDSPLIDPAILHEAVDLYLEGTADIVTNVFPRSFPKRESVEILSRHALERLATDASSPEDREHVTRYAYAHPEQFVIRNFSARQPEPELQLSVDTLQDFERAAALMAATSDHVGFPTVDRLIELARAMTPA